MKTLGSLLAAAAVGLLALPSAQAASVASDQAAALVVYPLIYVVGSYDTVVQLSNTSNQPVRAKCYYVDAAGTCSVSRVSCRPGVPGNCPLEADTCLPGWVETDFQVWLTPQQPIAWLASQGLSHSELPLDGATRQGPSGASNAGSGIPPFGEGPGGTSLGELKCYVTNPDGTPSESNVLQGEAAVTNAQASTDMLGSPRPIDLLQPATSGFGATTASFDNISGVSVGKYAAVGFRAIPGTNNEDNQLQLGGPGAEYDACPSVLIADHFFAFATNPVSGRDVESGVVLAPCSENFLTQTPTSVTAQFLVFNEFEQRFSTSKTINCWDLLQLSYIDTPDPTRSIFSVYVAGTLTGQTRIRGVNGGLIGILAEQNFPGATVEFANLNYQGERSEGDVVTVVR